MLRKQKRRPRSTAMKTTGPLDHYEMIQLYASRTLMKHPDIRENFLTESGFGELDLAKKLALKLPNGVYDKAAAEASLARLHECLEARHSVDGPLPFLRQNFEDLGEMLGIQDWEVLLFLGLNTIFDLTQDIYMLDVERPHGVDNRVLAEAVQVSLEETHRISAVLTQTMRPFECLMGERNNFRHGALFPFFSLNICRRLCGSRTTMEEMVMGVLRQAAMPVLTEADFPHLKVEVQLLTGIIRSAAEGEVCGTNILLHGPPGTGKTQLARLACQLAGMRQYEVCALSDAGSPVGRNEQLEYVFLAGKVLKGHFVLTCDECEELFNSPFGKMADLQAGKGVLNELMEQTPLPMIWICNDTTTLSAANARRFRYALKCPIPPEKVRKKIVASSMGGIVSKPLQKRLSKHSKISPAILQSTAETVRRLKSSGSIQSPMKSDDVALKLLNGILQLQAVQTLPKRPPKGHDPCEGIGGRYNPAYLNVDADLEHLATHLKKAKRVNICLMGPPGTGKTSWAHYLGKRLKRPLIQRKASDLICPFVGETEKQIAKAFAEAAERKGILLIDEVDSFLQARGTSQSRWTTSMVNEMLTQMEQFQGIFMASTNFFKSLDPASLRRFQIKLEFGYLKPEQSRAIFQTFCKKHRLGEPEAYELERLDELSTVTPGDFVVIERQLPFRPLESRAMALDWLEKEQSHKPDFQKSRSRLGFAS
ncbi:MAG: hypothetical protein RL648_359 [Verrucomicrobiota bacterium]